MFPSWKLVSTGTEFAIADSNTSGLPFSCPSAPKGEKGMVLMPVISQSSKVFSLIKLNTYALTKLEKQAHLGWG